MELEFGWNCKHLLPSLQKCRVLIENYWCRRDLHEQRSLSTAELLVYLNVPREDLLTRIAAGEISAKRQKDGKMVFGISAPWAYDDCFLKTAGGCCLYYQPHVGAKISFVEQLKHIKAAHPKSTVVPTKADVEDFERKAAERLAIPVLVKT